jgi:hypothetical protein
MQLTWRERALDEFLKVNWKHRLEMVWTTRPHNIKSELLIEVEVALRPTVSQPVRLGVLPLLEQVTRCYIYLSDNYFLYFSCRAPSLTRGRVCNLQCNNASSVSSYIATDGLSASSSWCRAHNQIWISLFDSCFIFSVFGSLTHIPHEQDDPAQSQKSEVNVARRVAIYEYIQLRSRWHQ